MSTSITPLTEMRSQAKGFLMIVVWPSLYTPWDGSCEVFCSRNSLVLIPKRVNSLSGWLTKSLIEVNKCRAVLKTLVRREYTVRNYISSWSTRATHTYFNRNRYRSGRVQ
jgi:hypothetical protein